MCKVLAVIVIVAIATVPYITSSLDSTFQSAFRTNHRRFLFSQNSNLNMCNFFCPLVCREGYLRSKSGCYLCQCATTSPSSQNVSPSSTMTAQQTQQQYTSVNGGVFLNNPCNPAVRHCRKQCTNGYTLGTNGCQFCACQSTTANQITAPVSTVQATTTNQVLSSHIPLQTLTRSRITQSTTSSSVTTTRPALKRTTFMPTSKQTSARITTQITTTISKTLNDPCIPSQKTCNKSCNGNYVKGPGGCQYCLCAKEIPPELRTTIKPTISKLGRNSTIPHYLDLSPTSEACIIAKVVCNQKCDHGFISHPDDCLFCSCRNKDNGQLNDVPNDFEVMLPNPCVQHTASCGVKCLNGYLMGPRDCQFCSCRHRVN